MATNNRNYYANTAVAVTRNGADPPVWTAIHGVQSFGMTTNFELEQVYELGQLAIYENIENRPDISISMQKVLDGYPLITCLVTQYNATSASLAGRQNGTATIGYGIWDDTKDSASGNATSEVRCSGVLINSFTFEFPVEGNFTESVEIIGNTKVWYGSPNITLTNLFPNNDDSPRSLVTGSGGVNRREDLIFDHPWFSGPTPIDANGAVKTISSCLLPPDIDGISPSGLQVRNTDGSFRAHLQNISVSTNLNREDLFELGRRLPYYRFAQFPVEVTCAITTTAVSGDLVSCTDEGVYGGSNLRDRTIQLLTREGTYLFLGRKNKLASIEHSGGDTGGGNVEITYNYSNFNDLVIIHSADPLVGTTNFHPRFYN